MTAAFLVRGKVSFALWLVICCASTELPFLPGPILDNCISSIGKCTRPHLVSSCKPWLLRALDVQLVVIMICHAHVYCYDVATRQRERPC